MPYILRNKATSIEIERFGGSMVYSVNKGDFDVILEDTGNGVPMVYIVMRSKAITENFIKLDWRDIGDPTFVSATELRDTILAWNVQQAIITAVTKVDSSLDSVLLLAENKKRKMATIYNNSLKYLYIKYGTEASADSFTLRIGPGDYLELPAPCYLGRIDGFWDEVNGNAMVTEIT